MASAAMKDVLIAVAVVGGILGFLWLYTGVWPPMVVVESGSMMHSPCSGPSPPVGCAGYGKVGTIDPGDMVFVKRVEKVTDVETLSDGKEIKYGRSGDVLIYYRDNIRVGQRGTPIIHRAQLWIEASGVQDVNVRDGTGPVSPDALHPNGFTVSCDTTAATYTYKWNGQTVARLGTEGIVIPELLLGNQQNPYRPCWSGFVTRGDNPVTNTAADQATPIQPSRQPIRLSWIEGKAIGEVPWFGLIKLALSSSPNYFCSQQGDPACIDVVTVGNAKAPGDLWTSLAISLAALVLAPLAFDWIVNKRRAAKSAGADDSRTAGESTEASEASLADSTPAWRKWIAKIPWIGKWARPEPPADEQRPPSPP